MIDYEVFHTLKGKQLVPIERPTKRRPQITPELTKKFLGKVGLKETLCNNIHIQHLLEDVLQNKFPKRALQRLPFFASLGTDIKRAIHLSKGSLVLDDDGFEISFVNQVEVEGGTTIAAELILERMIKQKRGVPTK